MSSANRVRLSAIKEATLGTTPASPRMRDVRMTGETLEFRPDFNSSDEIRSDRMATDPFLMMKASQGGFTGEMSYPVQNSPLASVLESAFAAAWSDTPVRDNDGVADSVITQITSATQVVTVTTGPAFATGHLVRFSGFALAANNGTFKCTTGSATAPAFLASGLVDDTAPAAAARMKVCGFQGAAGDVTATATGLASTVLNFTTLGLAVGQWISIGGAAVGDKFATAANAGWARITAIAANALTLDNLPIGWTTDSGTGKTIKSFFGDMLKNGLSVISHTFEKGFLDQVTPNYLTYKGMVVDSFEVSLASRKQITFSTGFNGMSGGLSTTPLDASTDPVTTNAVMAGNANVGRVSEGGSQFASPSWCKEVSFKIGNNLRSIEAIDSQSPVDIQMGDCSVTGKISAYFGDSSVYTKFLNGTPTSINSRVAKNNQALVFDVPRATYIGGGNPSASAKNTDVMISCDYQASYDPTTGAHVTLNRIEYFE